MGLIINIFLRRLLFEEKQHLGVGGLTWEGRCPQGFAALPKRMFTRSRFQEETIMQNNLLIRLETAEETAHPALSPAGRWALIMPRNRPVRRCRISL